MRLLAKRAMLFEDAATLLAELGATPAEVDQSLRSVGVAAAERPGECPLSRFLHAVVGSDFRVKKIRVTNKWMVLETRLRCGSRVWVRLPEPVRNFVVSAQAFPPDDTEETRFEQDNQG